MKKFLTIMFMLIFCASQVFADEDFSSVNATTDLWDTKGVLNTKTNEQKFVTDEEFEKALDEMDAKVNKWGHWAKNRKKLKGKEYSKGNESEIIKNEAGAKSEYPVICVTTDLSAGEGIIPVGHYQIRAQKSEDNNVTLNLYQGYNLLAKLRATETNDDFEQDELVFSKVIPVNDTQVKIIYGALDINAYTYLNIAQ